MTDRKRKVVQGHTRSHNCLVGMSFDVYPPTSYPGPKWPILITNISCANPRGTAINNDSWLSPSDLFDYSSHVRSNQGRLSSPGPWCPLSLHRQYISLYTILEDIIMLALIISAHNSSNTPPTTCPVYALSFPPTTSHSIFRILSESR